MEYSISEIRLFPIKIGARSKVKILDIAESLDKYAKRFSRDLKQLEENEERIPRALMRDLRKVESELQKLVNMIEKIKKKYKVR